MPRILPPFGFSSVRLRRFVAHPRILRANGSALSPCEGHAGEEAVLGAGQRAEVPHRLATNESVRRKIARPGAIRCLPSRCPLRERRIAIGFPEDWRREAAGSARAKPWF